MKIYPPFSEIQFNNYPRNLPLSAYEEAREWMIKYISRCQDVIGLYEFGSIISPPISDLDFLVVPKDGSSSTLRDYLARDKFDPLVRYMMMDNTLMVVNREGFRNIPKWDDMKLDCLYGESIEQVELTGEELYYTEICRVLDWLPERTLRFIEWILRKEVPIRVGLCVINSFTYTLKRLKNIFNISTERFEDYITNFKYLRNNWFSVKDSKEQLYQFMCEAIEITFEAMHLFSAYVRKKGIYQEEDLPGTGRFRVNPNISSWTTYQMFYQFTANDLEINAMHSLSASNKGVCIVFVPRYFYQHLCLYALTGGMIGSEIYKNIQPPPEKASVIQLPSKLIAITQERIRICNQMAIFLKKNRLKKGMLKMGWFYRPGHIQD